LRHAKLIEIDVRQLWQDIVSISLARKSASYCPRLRLLSQPPTSIAALHGPERIILRLKRPVQRRAVEELVGSHDDPTALSS